MSGMLWVGRVLLVVVCDDNVIGSGMGYGPPGHLLAESAGGPRALRGGSLMMLPTDDAVIKLIWLAICDIEDKRARPREAERGKPAGNRTAPARLVEGATTQGWKAPSARSI